MASYPRHHRQSDFLLAEDLLLLLMEDESGKPLADSTQLDLALAGAVIVDLTDDGRIALAGPHEQVKSGRLAIRDETPVGDDVLDQAMQRLAAKRPRKPSTALSDLTEDLREQLLGRLAVRGILRAEERKVLGIFPKTSWPAVDANYERGLRAGLREVLTSGTAPTPRQAALVSLLHSIGQAHKVLADPGDDTRALKRRAKEIAEGDFAGEAVSEAVEAVNAAVTAAVIAAATTSSR